MYAHHNEIYEFETKRIIISSLWTDRETANNHDDV